MVLVQAGDLEHLTSRIVHKIVEFLSIFGGGGIQEIFDPEVQILPHYMATNRVLWCKYSS